MNQWSIHRLGQASPQGEEPTAGYGPGSRQLGVQAELTEDLAARRAASAPCCERARRIEPLSPLHERSRPGPELDPLRLPPRPCGFKAYP
jgi:hypothetical protein